MNWYRGIKAGIFPFNLLKREVPVKREISYSDEDEDYKRAVQSVMDSDMEPDIKRFHLQRLKRQRSKALLRKRMPSYV